MMRGWCQKIYRNDAEGKTLRGRVLASWEGEDEKEHWGEDPGKCVGDEASLGGVFG